jgi:Ca2+ transporting ATPase
MYKRDRKVDPSVAIIFLMVIFFIIKQKCLIIIDLGSINPEVPTGNSHNSNNSNAVNNKANNANDEEPKKPHESARKEKSVLQAKLTRLAIQIGYGGKVY